MNRLTAILLAALFLFNLIGYKGVFFYLQQRSDSEYLAKIDADLYDESRLLTLKVDLNMPYLAENTTFERVSGEITVDGVIYKFVKRRIYNGQLVLLCLPDDQKTKLRSADKNYFIDANSLAAGSTHTSQKYQTGKITGIDYDQTICRFNFNKLPQIVNYNLPGQQSLPGIPITASPEKPPEQA